MKITAQDLAVLLEGTIEGDPTVAVSKPSKIEEAQAGSIAFLANAKYQPFLYSTKASVVLVKEDLQLTKKVNATLIRLKDPYHSFVKILEHFSDITLDYKGIHPTAIIDKTAVIGADVYIGAGTVIGKNVEIGNNTKIFANCFLGDYSLVGAGSIIYSGVNVYHFSKIGNHVIIHSGVVIGSDGFGFAPNEKGEYAKIPQIGNVIIEDHVEIGANSAVDRATMGSTIIRKGSKIDNLVQIGHNVEVGNHTVIAAQAGIAGSSKVGNHVVMGGQVGVVGHIEIADGTKINGKSGVAKSVKKTGEAISGSPAFNWRDEIKAQLIFRKLPELNERIAALERRLKELKEEDV